MGMNTEHARCCVIIYASYMLHTCTTTRADGRRPERPRGVPSRRHGILIEAGDGRDERKLNALVERDMVE